MSQIWKLKIRKHIFPGRGNLWGYKCYTDTPNCPYTGDRYWHFDGLFSQTGRLKSYSSPDIMWTFLMVLYQPQKNVFMFGGPVATVPYALDYPENRAVRDGFRPVSYSPGGHDVS